MAVAVAHIASLAANRKLRGHWLELWPRWSDVVEGVQSLLYNLGLRATPPQRAAHGYVEKAEYWAVVWGTAVMVITGVMLWASNYMLTLLPKVALDVATSVHFYEAVLATASIVIWHFYTVIFDPDVYPMDTAWLSGVSPRVREGGYSSGHEREHGAAHH